MMTGSLVSMGWVARSEDIADIITGLLGPESRCVIG